MMVIRAKIVAMDSERSTNIAAEEMILQLFSPAQLSPGSAFSGQVDHAFPNAFQRGMDTPLIGICMMQLTSRIAFKRAISRDFL